MSKALAGVPTRILRFSTLPYKMAAVQSIPHTIRTENEPRQTELIDATLSKIEQVNSTIRLLRLSLDKNGAPFRHLPGQWLDVHIPSIPQAGGFTITSSPSIASFNSSDPYVELAIQRSPNNAPAAYLWRPASEILDICLHIRVGGSFVYPPSTLSMEECRGIERVVLVAGGVGINPIMSMLSAMADRGVGQLGGLPRIVRLLYTTRRMRDEKGETEEVLFEKRIEQIIQAHDNDKHVDIDFKLFETGGGKEDVEQALPSSVTHLYRRITSEDLMEAIGSENERAKTVVFVCGPPKMTDEFVSVLKGVTGMDEKRVLCEKWW